MEIVIGNGLIGRNLHYFLKKVGDSRLITREEIDLSRDGWEVPSCEVAYICAGETSTERCRLYPKETRQVNIKGTVSLATKLLEKSHVVWLSSERVFDGLIPWRKVTDNLSPTTEYGFQKAKTEEILLHFGNIGITVVRFSKVIGWDMPLFEGWIGKLNKGEEIYPYSNMSMSPMPVSFVSEVLWGIGRERLGGLYQVSGDRDISYDRVASYIANYMGVDSGLVKPVECDSPHPWTTLESNLDVDIPDSWGVIEDWCRNRIPRRAQAANRFNFSKAS